MLKLLSVDYLCSSLCLSEPLHWRTPKVCLSISFLATVCILETALHQWTGLTHEVHYHNGALCHLCHHFALGRTRIIPWPFSQAQFTTNYNSINTLSACKDMTDTGHTDCWSLLLSNWDGLRTAITLLLYSSVIEIVNPVTTGQLAALYVCLYLLSFLIITDYLCLLFLMLMNGTNN